MVQYHLVMRKETLERVRMNGGLAPLGEGQCVRGCVRTWVGTYVLSLSGGDGARTSCAPPGVPALGRRLSAISMPHGKITSAPGPQEKKTDCTCARTVRTAHYETSLASRGMCSKFFCTRERARPCARTHAYVRKYLRTYTLFCEAASQDHVRQHS